LGETSPFVCQVQDWTNSFATKGLAIFGDVRARVFDGDDVGLTGRQKLYPKRVLWFAGLGACYFG
jgi:hypothetical protein